MWRLLLLFLCALSQPAWAHLAAAGQGAVRIVGDSAYAVIAVPVGALSGFDDNRDGLIDVREINAHRDMLSVQLSAMLELRSQGQPGRLVFEDLLLSHPEQASIGEDQLVLMRRYQWAAPVAAFTVKVHLFHAAATAQRQLALRAIQGGRDEMVLLTRERNSHHFFAGDLEVLRRFTESGAEHILLGPDHLLFLLTVLVLGAGWRYWLAVVTSFTVAHSITLVCAALGYMQVSARVVEPMIALSIVLMALENLLRGQKALRHRPVLVFACGLLHGLGIATGLVELGLASDNKVVSLFGFNLGVELGQLAFVGAVLLVLALLRRFFSHRVQTRVLQASSVFAAAMGAWWAAERLLG